MRKKIIALAIGAIMIVSAVGACFMEQISKDVLAGALTAIILPLYIYISYLNSVIKVEAEKKIKAALAKDSPDYKAIAKEEAAMEMPIVTKTSVKVDRSAIFAS